MGYSDKNPIEMHEGQPVMVVGNAPIIYWELKWNFNLVIYNNSRYPAYNVKVESIGSIHFSQLESLSKVNNLPPLKKTELYAKYQDVVEGDHTVADAIINSRIPDKFNNLILKLTYYDEMRTLYTTFVRFSNNEISNTEK